MPAAAVKRRVQALSGITGRKELRRWHGKRIVKWLGSTGHTLFELPSLSIAEVPGIPSVGVKSVDIRRNTGGEGGYLDRY